MQLKGQGDDAKRERRRALARAVGLDAGAAVLEKVQGLANVSLSTLLEHADQNLRTSAQEMKADIELWMAERLITSPAVRTHRSRYLRSACHLLSVRECNSGPLHALRMMV